MKTYETVLGDTFDKIAYEQLGSEYLLPLLLEANQQYRDVLVFSAGIVLNIPEYNSNNYQNVPEWLMDDGNSYQSDQLADEDVPVIASGVDS